MIEPKNCYNIDSNAQDTKVQWNPTMKHSNFTGLGFTSVLWIEENFLSLQK